MTSPFGKNCCRSSAKSGEMGAPAKKNLFISGKEFPFFLDAEKIFFPDHRGGKCSGYLVMDKSMNQLF